MQVMGVDVDEDDAFSGYRDGDARLGDFGEHGGHHLLNEVHFVDEHVGFA